MVEQISKKTVYIKFFVSVDINSIKKLTEIIQNKLKEGIEQFVLLISSPGGNVFAGISGYNFLKGIPAKVITHNFGSADSIATILFCAGSKRYCVPNARFLLHGIGMDAVNMRLNEKVIDEFLKGLIVDRKNISKVIADNTSKSVEEVEKNIFDGTVLTSQEALDYGLVHEIKSELFEKGAEIIEIIP